MNSVSSPHACHMCNKSFARKYTLGRHLESVHGEKQSTDGDESSEMEYNANRNIMNACIKSVELKNLTIMLMKKVQRKKKLTKR